MMPTLLRVSNIDQSIQFYTEVLGMQLLRKRDYPAGRFTLASLGYDDEESSAIELSHNWAMEASDPSIGKNSLVLEVGNASQVCESSKYAKGEVLPIDVMADDAIDVIDALLKDPDGYLVSVVEKSPLLN